MFFLFIFSSSILLISSVFSAEFIEEEPRLIHGFPATLGQFPWQAALYMTGINSGSWFCGGTIINNDWILTSGFCIDGAAVVRVLTGLVAFNDTSTESNSTELFLHPDYDSRILENDIGLIKLTKSLTFDASTNSINLATSSDFLDADVYITISGWGITGDGAQSLSPILNYVPLITINNTDCDAFYGQATIFDGMVCAVSFTNVLRATCDGDTGGPAVTNPDTDPVLVATVSFTSDEGCETGAPSGHTRTAYHRDWILEQTGI